MSAYGTSERLRALIQILHVPFAQRLRVDNIIDVLPQIYQGHRDSAGRKIRRDLDSLMALGFIVNHHKAAYWIVGYAFPDENLQLWR